MILQLDRQSHTPLYVQITQQIRALIVEGRLKVGDQLPPSRALAATLGVHRTTINNAYAELEADGIIHSHVGRGTFVASFPRTSGDGLDSGQPRESPAPFFWDALLVSAPEEDRLHSLICLQYREDATSFAYALPSPDLFPLEDIKRCVDRALRREGRSLLQMGESLGYAPLREYLVGRMARAGIRVKADEILITNGCQQSLDLIRRVLVDRGDTVLIESPTYPGAFSVFDTRDIKCISVPVSGNGIELSALEDVLSHHQVKLLYTVPTFHNPTGVTMDLAARRQLLGLALKYRVPIVEDDIYGDLRYDGPSLPALKALDENGVVVYLNSFSKIGFPGLRVGWITAPSIVIEQLRGAKQACDLHTNVLAQAALCELSKQGYLAKHLKRVRRAYAERRNRMLDALEKHFPEGTSWSHPEGGMCVWVTLPTSLDAATLLSLAVEEGIVFSPGEIFYLSMPQPHTLRLTFTMADTSKIEAGVKRLGLILRKQLEKVRAQPARAEPIARTALV